MRYLTLTLKFVSYILARIVVFYYQFWTKMQLNKGRTSFQFLYGNTRKSCQSKFWSRGKYKKAGTSIIVALKQCYRKGLFNNCVTLKLPFFDPPTIMLYYKWWQDPPYVTWRLTQTSPLFHLFLFLEVEIKQRYAPTHCFKQLNQIVRFR